MQETFREIIHEMGGTPLVADAVARALYGLAPVGRIIHEVGTTRMGNDAADVGAERELPGARREEPVRRRRRSVRLERAQELHVDDSRAGDAHVANSSRSSATGS